MANASHPSLASPGEAIRPANLLVLHPSGSQLRVPLAASPFTIGRHVDNLLVLRDNRASRSHARLVFAGGDWLVEDLDSRHGTFVNGERVKRHRLRHADRIEFGFADSYRLVFQGEEHEINRLLEQVAPSPKSAAPASNLAKLRALVEVARTLQSSLSTQDVLAAVVDAALTITGTERGFLMLRQGDDLQMSLARDQYGSPLSESDLRVPKRLIQRALQTRRDLLSMNFDPSEEEGLRPEMSVADLELRSVVCVPLVRVRTGQVEETSLLSTANETVGLLYLDSRMGRADLSSGNRELLQTLALEASTILENARLLEEERAKHRLEEELNIAREIQMSLLPRSLPSTGWFRAAGSSLPARQVGGDYFDVRPLAGEQWSAIVVDVSGKGVSSALLASLLQGAFMLAAGASLPIESAMEQINRFLLERTEGEKYATLFYCTLDSAGRLRWANAGHVKPILLRADGTRRTLGTTGMPVGLLESATYRVEEALLAPGDKIIAFTDGLPEACSATGLYFDAARLGDLLAEHATAPCTALHETLVREVQTFTLGVEQADDITTLVLEYHG